jgi:exopolysaccharide biosynthesis polyprenyl glycosylphosphotransferase
VLVLPSPDVSPRDVQRLSWALEASGVHLYVGTGLLDVASRRAVLAAVGGLRMIHVRGGLASTGPRLAKEILERSAAIAACALLTPVLLALAVAVRLESPGPALFRQERVGRHGRSFTMLKFRTMRVAAEADLEALAKLNEGAGVLFKLRVDPRTTRLGRLLRRYSLDELPQLINVVRGDMALVGPRPALPREVAQYDVDPRRRLAVKPGITGLWQVSGRSDLSWEQTVRLDLAYVDNWSLGLDLRILLRTFGAVLGHRGAY